MKKLLSVGIRYGYDYAMIGYFDDTEKLYMKYEEKKISPIENKVILIKDEHLFIEIPTCISVENKHDFEIYCGNEAKHLYERDVLWGITPTNENIYTTNTTDKKVTFTREEVTTIVINYLIGLLKNKMSF